MRIVLLSGGSGKRLWPLSNEIRSKIFLKLLPSENGGKESMIQRVCRQLDEVGLLESTSIVAHKSQVEIIQNHVGDKIPIFTEPHKRGTFTAVALAASYLHSRLLATPDETVCVIPVDIFVESEFFHLLREFPGVLSRSGSNLALLGTIPRHPSSQYGYILPQETGETESLANDYYSVAQFVEKPSEENALSLIDQNAMWNCGVFAFSLSFMLSCVESKGLPVVYEELLDRYEQLPEASFDIEVVEQSQHSVVIPYDKAWQDLGDWGVLPDYFGNNVIGLGEISSDSMNTHLVNELQHPIHVIGVSNIIVAASADGILVANKYKSNQIKKMLNYSQKPMYGEKRWGTYRILDHSKTEMETLTKKVEMLPGKNTSYHLHPKREETWTILSGTGEFMLEAVNYQIGTGDVLQIPAGAKHAIKANTPLVYIEIQIGTELVDDDITRIAMTWDEIIQYCNREAEGI